VPWCHRSLIIIQTVRGAASVQTSTQPLHALSQCPSSNLIGPAYWLEKEESPTKGRNRACWSNSCQHCETTASSIGLVVGSYQIRLPALASNWSGLNWTRSSRKKSPPSCCFVKHKQTDGARQGSTDRVNLTEMAREKESTVLECALSAPYM
jgi:hypothetical protein